MGSNPPAVRVGKRVLLVNPLQEYSSVGTGRTAPRNCPPLCHKELISRELI